MHVVVMGCGRVGSSLALMLEALGHTVSVIDQDEAAFIRLGEKFKGGRIAGMGFDQDTLIEAGIQRAEAFAAVSNGDNSNIIAARVARETFNVDNVVARIYDAKRAEIYERLGIPTIATVPWTANRLLRQILGEALEETWRAERQTRSRRCLARATRPTNTRQRHGLGARRRGPVTRTTERQPDCGAALSRGDRSARPEPCHPLSRPHPPRLRRVAPS